MTAPLTQGLIATIETALNTYLRLDPATLARLQALSGKVIGLELAGLDWVAYLLPRADGIQVLGTYEGAPDAWLHGSPWALLRMGTQKGNSRETRAALFSGDVEIRGDVELGQRFKAILDTIEIDWEEILSKAVGDVLAHQAGNAARGARAWTARALNTLGQNFAEYQQEESRNLPGCAEMEEFLAAVDTLRDDVARLKQRIQRLREHLAGREKGG